MRSARSSVRCAVSEPRRSARARRATLLLLAAVAPIAFAAHDPVARSGDVTAGATAFAASEHANAAEGVVGARTRVVIVDAGHGGRDPGKIGPNGLQEKDVALWIAQRVAAVLRERGYEVHLTRTRDTLIALADRAKLANRLKADRPGVVFLSIHANAAKARTARGFETFFLSEARTEDERRVAEMENEAIHFEEYPALPADDGLDKILSNLRSDFLMRASHDLAAVMQDNFAAFHP